MRPLFHPRLINGPTGDPGVYVNWIHHSRAILLDLPWPRGLCARDLLKVTHVFVSHAHMDHFMGLDELVRVTLGRNKLVRIFGPHPMVRQVCMRLSSYTWNLTTSYREGLVLEVWEVDGGSFLKAQFHCKKGFADTGLREVSQCNGTLWEEPGMRVRFCLLDHKVPSMAFSLEEQIHIKVLKGKLQEHGLRPGRWLLRLREAIVRGEDEAIPIPVEPKEMGQRPLGWLKENFVVLERGQKIGYVVDAAPTEENSERIVNLVQGSDFLFIEAPLLEREREAALEKAHLTAFLVGRIAAMANAARVIPLHISPKYSSDPSPIIEEVMRGFGSGRRKGHMILRG
jgi:ribonuclease Z